MVLLALPGKVIKAHAQVSFEPLIEGKVYNDFVVGPGKVDIEMDPGESRTFELSIANRLGIKRLFSVKEEDFTGSSNPEQAVVLLGDDRGPYSMKDYVHLATTSVFIQHAQRARVPLTISIPADAQPGGAYGSIVISTISDPNASRSGGTNPTSNIITRIGTLFFIRIKGPTKESGQLSQFLLSGGNSIILNQGSIFFDILYKNDGNVHLDPYGTIQITNMLGSPVGSIDIDPWFAMPGSLRFREVEWTPPFLFGRYVAHAAIHRGYGTSIDEADIVFWVIPWKLLVAILGGIIIVITFVRWIFSHFTISSRKK